jgi:DNA-binding Lrp family transcriptional regulator
MEPSSLRREKITRILQREAGNTQNIIATSLGIWEQVSLPLARMIGRLGVASLFERCVSLQALKHAWLPHSNQAVLDGSLYTSVWDSVRQQPPDIALTTSIEIFSCFFELLSMLIGERLTMRVFLTGIPNDPDEPKDLEVQ